MPPIRSLAGHEVELGQAVVVVSDRKTVSGIVQLIGPLQARQPLP